MMILSVVSVIVALTSQSQAAHLQPRPAYVGRMGQIMDFFLKINDQADRDLKKSSGDLMFNNNEIVNLSDSTENFSRVLQAGYPDWREKLLFCKPRPMDIDDVFGSPMAMTENNQLALRRTNMIVFSESIRPESFDVLYNNDLWHWWLYKGVRGQDNAKDTKGLFALISHNYGDTAVMALVKDEAHMWRRGYGSFMIVGSRNNGPLGIVYPVKETHGHEFTKSTLSMTYETVQVQPGDIVIYCSGISMHKFTVQEMVEICRNHADETGTLADKFSRLFSERIPNIYRGYRLHVYQIKKNPN